MLMVILPRSDDRSFVEMSGGECSPNAAKALSLAVDGRLYLNKPYDLTQRSLRTIQHVYIVPARPLR